jgi:hypothetical protein
LLLLIFIISKVLPRTRKDGILEESQLLAVKEEFLGQFIFEQQ